MNYFFALKEGRFDKYISLSTIFDTLSLSTEYTSSYIANYLCYYEIQNKINAYYIDSNSGKIFPIKNQKEVIYSLFIDVKNAPLTLNTIRDMPIELAARLNDINFIAEELNNLDIFNEFGGPDFTDTAYLDLLVENNYENERSDIGAKLYELALTNHSHIRNMKTLNTDKEQELFIDIKEVQTFIGFFSHQFIIRFNELVLVNIDEFLPKKNLFHPIFNESKVKLVRNLDKVNSNEEIKQAVIHQKNKIINLESTIKDLEAQKKKLEIQLEDTSNNLKAQSYLDPTNKNFCMEMKLCHDTWNHLYKNKNTSYKNHSEQVVDYLTDNQDCHVSNNAIERISTVTKPKDKPAKSRTKN